MQHIQLLAMERDSRDYPGADASKPTIAASSRRNDGSTTPATEDERSNEPAAQRTSDGKGIFYMVVSIVCSS